ncbi:hypothetical protein Golomagni_00633 [Golovinomyces magnicellulatus]|nr:hypothetical protein Golomagni_00633 [Golovinomyces magnicellulatus]
MKVDSLRRHPMVQVIFKFLFVVVTSTVLSSLLHSLTNIYFNTNSIKYWRPLDTWQDIGFLIGWRITELGLEWLAGYDSYDAVALGILSHGPPLDLLVTFYGVPPTAVLHPLLINSFVTYISFRLVRPLSPPRMISSSRKDARRVANCEILQSTAVQLYIVFLAASVYTIVLFTAYKTYFPEYLVTYFNQIPNITAAYSPFYITKFPATILVGLAAKTFIFTPAIATPNDEDCDFDTVTASLWETLLYNIWGYSSKTKVVIKRTALLMIVSGMNTFLRTLKMIDGVEFTGAAIYSAIIILAFGITGTVLGLVAAF